MLSPQQFAKETGLSYQQVLQMCKSKEINALETEGGHFKIPPKEVDRFKNSDYVSKDEYLKVIRENERLKTLVVQLKSYVLNLDANAPKFINNYFSNFSTDLRHEMIKELKVKIDQLSDEKENIDKQLLESIKTIDDIENTLGEM